MLREEAPALEHVVRAAAEDGGADDARDLDEQGVVLLECLEVGRIWGGLISRWDTGLDRSREA